MKLWRTGYSTGIGVGARHRLYFEIIPFQRMIQFTTAPTDRALREAIFNQIAKCHVVVIPLGMYANYSKWIKKEINGANHYAKPILGVNPWGQERKSSVVAAAAKETVGWNSKSVVGGIWRLYRG